MAYVTPACIALARAQSNGSSITVKRTVKYLCVRDGRGRNVIGKRLCVWYSRVIKLVCFWQVVQLKREHSAFSTLPGKPPRIHLLSSFLYLLTFRLNYYILFYYISPWEFMPFLFLYCYLSRVPEYSSNKWLCLVCRI